MISQFDWIRIRVSPAATLADAAAAAVDIAKQQQVLVVLDFNGAPLSVTQDVDANAIVSRFASQYSHLSDVQS